MNGWVNKMKKLLKLISISSYMLIVSYLSNKMVDWRIMSKNYVYIIIVLPILLIGVISLNNFFDRKK